MVRNTRSIRLFNTVIALAGFGWCFGAPLAGRSEIFPAPRELASSGSDFVLDEQVTIVVPVFPSEQDRFLVPKATSSGQMESLW